MARLFVFLGLCVLAVSLSGCAEYAYWHGRTFYGVDCAPQVVQANQGKCVYLKKGESHAGAQTR